MISQRVVRSICALLAFGFTQGSATGAAALSPPSNVSAVGSSESRIDVSWRDNSSNETGFEVRRSTNGPNGPFSAVAATAPQAVSYGDAGLNPSTQYCYKVRALRRAGGKTSSSALSAPACAPTLALPVPAAPSNLHLVAMSDSRMAIFWQDNSTGETGFEVYRSGTESAGAFTLVATTSHDNISDGGLSPSTQYCYQVRAFVAASTPTYSGFSDTACATTAAPPAPYGLHVITSTTGIDLDADGYRLDVWKDFGHYLVGVTSANLADNGTLTISDLAPLTPYQLELRGVSINCDLAGGNPRDVTTGDWWEAGITVNFDISCAPVTQLAFADTTDGNAEIYLVNSNGTGTTRLTTHPASDVEPAWSPDGTRIAFRSDRDGADEIYVMNADGSSPGRLTQAAGGNFRPAWSPDGTKIAFTSYRDGNGEIYVMNADGSGPVNITNHPADDGDPAWSPDGTRIAFRSGRDRPPPYAGIFLMDAAGSAVVSLSSDPWIFDSQPAWSPDGAWLAITTHVVERQRVLLMNLDGSFGGSTIPSDPECGVHSDPVWSADSRKVAFAETNWCHPDPESGVRVVRLNGLPMEATGLRIAGGFNPSWRR